MDRLLRALYKSEINIQIGWLWDGEIDVRIGDKMNGFVDQFNCDTFEQLEIKLEKRVKRAFPNSEFAKTYTL